jgi:hypothetical protein
MTATTVATVATGSDSPCEQKRSDENVKVGFQVHFALPIHYVGPLEFASPEKLTGLSRLD